MPATGLIVRQSLTRILIATIIAVPACAAIVGMLLVLPGGCAMGAIFVGLPLFMIGHELQYRWMLALGGVLMFAGVFAAALLGALG
jgi:hypothetical protein